MRSTKYSSRHRPVVRGTRVIAATHSFEYMDCDRYGYQFKAVLPNQWFVGQQELN